LGVAAVGRCTYPHPSPTRLAAQILDRQPYGRSEGLITGVMLRYMLSQARARVPVGFYTCTRADRKQGADRRLMRTYTTYD
jgi:hypothetical protein